MPVDTRGFSDEHLGKRLRVHLQDGDVDEITLLELTVCAEPEPCCGITYRLLSTNRGNSEKQAGGVYWTGFRDVQSFQIVGEQN